MRLAIPGKIVEFADAEHHLAVVDASGVRRKINIDLRVTSSRKRKLPETSP